MNAPMEFVSSETSLLMSTPDFTLPEKEQALARRFQRRGIFERELVFEFTRDPGLLHQYYKLREDEYNSVYGISSLSGSESEHDHSGLIMVARMGNMCVGGVRLNTKTPKKPTPLPLEINDFRIEEHFSFLEYKQLGYSQISALVLLPEFRGSSASRNMLKRTVEKASSLNLHMAFATCPLINARLYRRDFVAMGLTDTKIHTNVQLPLYPYLEEIPLYLMSIPFHNLLSNSCTESEIGQKDKSHSELSF